LYLKNELFNSIAIPINFDFSVIKVRDNNIYLKELEKSNLISIDLTNMQNTQTFHLGKENNNCGINLFHKFICCWKPIDGKLYISDYNSNCSFNIYYACLGKSDIGSSNGQKKRYTDIISTDDGIIVRIEKSKYILVEF